MALLSIIWLLTSITVSISSSAIDLLCANTNAPLSIEVMTDKYPAETSWNIRNTIDNTVVLKGGAYSDPLTLHNETHCLLSTGCLEFSIFDSFGDGVCCEDYQGNGYYKVFYDNYLIKEGGVFKHRETSVKFGGNCMLDPSSFKPSTSSSESNEATCGAKCGSGVGGQYLVFYGMGPHKSPLRECAGHCSTDSDCSHDLVCFQREEGMDSVPGCYTVPYADLNCRSSFKAMMHYISCCLTSTTFLIISLSVGHVCSILSLDCISQTQFDSYSNVKFKSSQKSASSSAQRKGKRHGSANHGFDDFSVYLILITVTFILALSIVSILHIMYKFYLCFREGHVMH